MNLELKELISINFDIDPINIQQLVGYCNLNYKVTTSTDQYILKTYENIHLLENLLQESSVLLQLHAKGNSTTKYPRPIKMTTGEYVKILEIDGKKIIIRLLAYIPGDLLNDVVKTPALMKEVGKSMAELLNLLKDVEFKDLANPYWKIENY